jgi:hypothetical protein
MWDEEREEERREGGIEAVPLRVSEAVADQRP